MDRKSRILVGEILSPFLVGIGLVWKTFDKTLLAWWLGPLLQRKENDALARDVRQDVPFLCTNGRFVKPKRTKVLPFDYAEVYIELGNMRFCFTRGRGELNLSLSPVRLYPESYELAVVMAALDSKEIAEVKIPTELTNLDALLRSRFDDLNQVFSETKYLRFKQKLLCVKENIRMLTRQAEWELNKRLGHQLRLR